MPRASLWLASLAPASSSGVSVGKKRSSCSTVVMRCFNCQRQSFQSASGTSCQKPRPADLNCLRLCDLTFCDQPPAGGSSPLESELSACIVLVANYKFDL